MRYFPQVNLFLVPPPSQFPQVFPQVLNFLRSKPPPPPLFLGPQKIRTWGINRRSLRGIAENYNLLLGGGTINLLEWLGEHIKINLLPLSSYIVYLPLYHIFKKSYPWREEVDGDVWPKADLKVCVSNPLCSGKGLSDFSSLNDCFENFNSEKKYWYRKSKVYLHY